MCQYLCNNGFYYNTVRSILRILQYTKLELSRYSGKQEHYENTSIRQLRILYSSSGDTNYCDTNEYYTPAVAITNGVILSMLAIVTTPVVVLNNTLC